MDAIQLFKDGATAGILAKFLVDIVKKSPVPAPTSIFPVLALAFSEFCAFLMFMTGTDPFTRQAISLTVLVGIAGTAGAMGITMFQTKADKVEEKIDVALDLKDGTKADVERIVNKNG